MKPAWTNKTVGSPQPLIRATFSGLALTLVAVGGLALGQDAYPPSQIPIGDQSTDASRYNVIWTSPSTTGSSGSMPLGNGDIALNAWVESGGDLVFYISKSDAFDDSARLCKVGRVRVRFTPTPFTNGAPFLQTLDIQRGEMRVTAGPTNAPVSVKLWVDANQPVIHVETANSGPARVDAQLEIVRPAFHDFTSHLHFSDINKNRSGGWLYAYPDTVASGPASTMVWYHHNTNSLWHDAMSLQLIPNPEALGFVDPYLNRVFGGWVEGSGFTNASPTNLVSTAATGTNTLAIYILTETNSSPAAWQARIQNVRDTAAAVPPAQAYTNHLAWWSQFWQRSWIHLGSQDAGENNAAWSAAFGYALQRYVTACAGRGAFPVKFNGSLFTVEYEGDPDYRLWGPGYWVQNTRHMYWSMLEAGDFDMMQPLFNLFSGTLNVRRQITSAWFGHAGSYVPECSNIHGLADCDTYGWNVDHSGTNSVSRNDFYLAYYYEPLIELGWMMFDYADYTGDTNLLVQQALPLIDDGVHFYHEHFKVRRDAGDHALGTNEVYQPSGQYIMYPANACETWWSCTNPAPDIVGWRMLLSRVLALDSSCASASQWAYWQNFNSRLPDVPLRNVSGGQALGFAQTLPASSNNGENPELYAVFPYRMYGLGKTNLDLATRTYANRVNKGSGCWRQDAIDAALLGITADARSYVLQNYSSKDASKRFPAFWGPNFDWSPDEDNGGAANTALQRMLAQWDNGQLRILPTWPAAWDVDFRLHGPGGATVHCLYTNGSIQTLELFPTNLPVVMPPWLGAAAPLRWNGSAGGNWDTSTANWLSGDLATNWNNANPDSALFAATGAGTVNLTTGISINSLTFSNAGYVLAGNTLTLAGAPSRITTVSDAAISSVVAGAASLTKAGPATLAFNGLNTLAANVTISAGTLAVGSSGKLLLSGTYSGTPVVTVTGGAVLAFAVADPFGYDLAGGLGGLDEGPARMVLNNGTIQYNSATANTPPAYGSNNDAHSFTTASGAGTLEVSTPGVTWTLGTYRPGNSGSLNDGIVNNGGLVVTGPGSLNIRKYITGAGGLTLNGPGTLTLGPAPQAGKTGWDNAYTSDTTINNGVLRLRGDYAAANYTAPIPYGAGKGNVILNSPGLLDLNTRSVTVNGLSGNGTVTSSAAGAAAFTVGANDQTALFSGVIQDGAGVVALSKTGAGALTLSGANAFTGATTISNGALIVNGSLAAGSTVTVLASGTLGGTGTVSGPVTLNGALSPGSGVGTLSTGAETWNGGGSYLCEMNGTNSTACDLVSINGPFTSAATPGNPFTIRLASLTPANTPGPLAGFNPSRSFAWTVATAGGGMNGFNPAAFIVNTSAFSNAFTGSFGVTNVANALVVRYAAPANPPLVAPVGRLPDGSFQLSISGAVGQPFSVRSTNLITAPFSAWPVLTNGTVGASGTVLFSDPSAAADQQRFYGVSSP
jgi:autotransporter-associated beta strand protein